MRIPYKKSRVADASGEKCAYRADGENCRTKEQVPYIIFAENMPSLIGSVSINVHNVIYTTEEISGNPTIIIYSCLSHLDSLENTLKNEYQINMTSLIIARISENK